MARRAPNSAVLDAAHAAFVQGGVSINVASCDAARVPSVARAFGCRVARDRRSVTVFLPVARSQALLRDLRAGGAVAAVFSLPATHETLQLKGASAEIVRPDDADRVVMDAYGRGFIEAVRKVGYREPFASAMVAAVSEQAVGVRFSPTVAFNQTPGPSAGQPLEPRR